MKKTYILPSLRVVLTQHEQPLAASGVTGSIDGSYGIGYGGVDENGEKDPDVKASAFDFEWE